MRPETKAGASGMLARQILRKLFISVIAYNIYVAGTANTMVKVQNEDLTQGWLGMLRHCELGIVTLILLDHPSHQCSSAWSTEYTI